MLFGQRRTGLALLEPDAGLDHCPRILLSCFRAGTSVSPPAVSFLHVNLSVGIHAVGEYVDGAETLSI